MRSIEAASFWAIEECYHEAWGSVLQNVTSAEYKEYAHRCVAVRRPGEGMPVPARNPACWPNMACVVVVV